MRISDWSSDVCSSDLPELRAQLRKELLEGQDAAVRMKRTVAKVPDGGYLADLVQDELAALENLLRCVAQDDVDQIGRASCRERVCSVRVDHGGRRSSKKQNTQERIKEIDSTKK